ncbi:putative peptide zinc metalloprotease protein [Asanoa hainanensis]|uniref:Putative peptide zinc metalloprotease protein n=1 Tax=Asanoa hainanensis TaxID=560556 RepID=A0A239K960_9ACTN|nr:cyclic nucleotide-binding protein [Asanoa hainanensis]SNT14163.1 putative peptide zinc metalloprotease protein [Asanoa hainanensis]
MTVVETRVSVWEALAGRAPGQPIGPHDPGMWAAVVERLNPARAKPVLRAGIEQVDLVSVRDVPYVMLRSPDDRGAACYLRLTPEEWQLATLMDGTRTVARLVAEFARIGGRLAPDQVTRVVADLAANRMLAELPVDAFRPLARVHRRPWPIRLGRSLLAFAQGRRTVIADIDPLVGFLYRAGGRFLFHKAVAALLGVIALAGLLAFGWTWWHGEESVFLTGGSYAVGAAVLLGLNVLALACHELGHALATKHAGRRVPAAGFLVYFGIPSVFVDTTDVWMAGRRARMTTTAAGPAAGLVLAGIAGLVGVFVPEAAPWTFKLAFAWYLNALFNLNPFLALDGYYLLMDWLEIPNLRARGLTFVVSRLRRRPPRWSELDREGRLVALYGTVAVLWVAIAVNLFWRIWTDRVAGLTIGLWRSGWPARILLAAVICGLAAPLVYLAAGWISRRVSALRRRLEQRSRDLDAPRRLDALRASALGRLSGGALADLAAAATWVRPRTGQQLVFAGSAQRAVYVVVDGAVEARRPDDPSGLVRQRLGAGGVVGLASALSGAPAALAWHTAGTTLLSIPPSAVSRAIGPVPGPPPAEWDQADRLFAEAPALQSLSAEDRMGLVSAARPILLAPGDPVSLDGATDAVVVESGTVVLPDGTDLRRGTLIGPIGDGPGGVVATARTPTRLWSVPALPGVPLLLGADPSVVASVAGAGPQVGVHPSGGYPPLAAPPGPPPVIDETVDGRFERRLWWLTALLLLLALFLTGTNFLPGPAWAEMPADRALLSTTRGTADVQVNGKRLKLSSGAKVYVTEGDQVKLRDRSSATLTFRGGSVTVLCAGSGVAVGELWSSGDRRTVPHGSLRLADGRVLVDTASTRGTFRPLDLSLDAAGSRLTNDGAAWYRVSAAGTVVSKGSVRVDGELQSATDAALDCGDGREVPRPAGPTDEPSPSEEPSPTDLPSPTATPSVTPTPPAGTDDDDDDDNNNPPPAQPGDDPVPPVTQPTTRPPTTTQPPVDTNKPPTITWVTDPGGTIDQQIGGESSCGRNGTAAFPVVSVTDDKDSDQSIKVTVSWSGFDSGSNSMSWDGNFYGQIGPVPYPGKPNEGGTLSITVTATDTEGESSSIDGSNIAVAPCNPPTPS